MYHQDFVSDGDCIQYPFSIRFPEKNAVLTKLTLASGEAAPNSIVTVKLDKSVEFHAVTDLAGKWQTAISLNLADGEHSLLACNKTEIQPCECEKLFTRECPCQCVVFTIDHE